MLGSADRRSTCCLVATAEVACANGCCMATYEAGDCCQDTSSHRAGFARLCSQDHSRKRAPFDALKAGVRRTRHSFLRANQHPKPSRKDPHEGPSSIRPTGRTLVLWNAASRHSPARFVATSVWTESRSGAGADFPRITTPPTASIRAISGPRDRTLVTRPTRGVPLSHVSKSCRCDEAISWCPLVYVPSKEI